MSEIITYETLSGIRRIIKKDDGTYIALDIMPKKVQRNNFDSISATANSRGRADIDKREQ